MLAAVTVVQSAIFLIIACSMQGQSVHSSSKIDPETNVASTAGQSFSRVQRWRFARHLREAEERGVLHPVGTASPDFIRQLENRLRAKQMQIFRIQIGVNDIVHSGRNFSSADALPPQQLDSIKRKFEIDTESDARPEADDVRISRSLLRPTCEIASGQNRSLLSRQPPKDFLLFFNIVPPRRLLHPETIQIKSAQLHLRIRPDASSLIETTDDEKSKKKKNNKNNNKKNQKKKSKVVKDEDSLIPDGILKVSIHSFDPLGSTEKISPRKQLMADKGKRRPLRKGKGPVESRKALKTVSFDPRNSSIEWLQIGLLKAAEKWYRAADKQPGIRVTVVDSTNKPIDPFRIFYDFDCEQQKLSLSAQPPQLGASTGELESGRKAETTSDGKQLNITSTSNDAYVLPYLEIVAKASPKKFEVRKQRHLTSHKRRGCHLRPILISTADGRLKNLTNIIAPVQFYSGVCEGFCMRCREWSGPKPIGNQELISSNSSSSSSSCRCAPIKKTPLAILTVDERNVVYHRKIPNAVVTKCGCVARRLDQRTEPVQLNNYHRKEDPS